MPGVDFSFPVPQNLLPRLTPDNRPYWEAALREELVVPHCERCGRDYFPLSPRCPECLSDKVHFKVVAQEGSVASWVRYQKNYYPWTEEAAPYVVALLDIVPGVRLPMLVRPRPERDPRIGEKVKISFMQAGENFMLPVCSLLE